MASHCGYVVQIKEIRKHTNADRLQIATIFGNDVVVSLDTKEGDIGVYFPVDLQLSERFCEVNDLVRRKDENGKQAGGFLEPGKRNIKAIKLRGEKSDGLYLPISCLSEFCDVSTLRIGDIIDTINGEQICRKYIPRKQYTKHGGHSGHRVPKVNFAPTFYEHIETEQLAYNLNKFRSGDIVQLTLKCHGTSGRTGNLNLVRFKKQNFIQKLLKIHPKQYFEYGYVTGTRRVVLDENHHGGYYESDDFRLEIEKKFVGKLLRGEVVYYEIVGFQGKNGAPIMANCDNKKVKDDKFTKQYGDYTVFSYGCDPKGTYEEMYCADSDGNGFTLAPCCDVYVYRMTMVNDDGDVVEYSPAQIKERCEHIGVKVVPEFETFIIPDGVDAGEYVKQKVEQYYDGPCPIGKTHIREGVVARILNRTGFEVYKHKNFYFKVLEGIVKDEAAEPDMEEAQELAEEDLNENEEMN